MAWVDAVVTNGGNQLLTQTLTGGKFNVTEAAGGTNTVIASSLMAQTTLKSQMQILPIVSVSDVDGGKKFKLQITNKGLTDGYTLNQVGLWAAIDGDAPVLFVILQDETGVVIPAESENPDFVLEFYMIVPISNEISLTVNLSSSAVLTMATLDEYNITVVNALANKADLVDGKVPDTQLPEMNYDPAGTAAGVQGNLTAHNTDTTAHQDIRNDLKLKADLEDGKILDTQLPAMDYVPTSRTINGVALTKDITLTPTNVNAAALDLSNVENADFYKKAKEAGMGQTYFFLHITFSSYFAGQAYTVTGGSFSYEGTVPESLEAIVAVTEPSSVYTVSCQDTNKTVEPTCFGIYNVIIAPNLANTTWKEIDMVIASNAIPSTWAIGDTKDITLTTKETITLQIYDFNHDDLADGTGRAGITFGMKNLLKDLRAMNSTATNKGSFTGSEIYAWLSGDLWNSLPDDLKLVIKPVTKQTSAGLQSTTINTETMSIFLFSEVEVLGSIPWSVEGEGNQYPIFTDDLSRIKRMSGNTNIWWTRSPPAYAGNTTIHNNGFACISKKGGPSVTEANQNLGVCFGFCV